MSDPLPFNTIPMIPAVPLVVDHDNGMRTTSGNVTFAPTATTADSSSASQNTNEPFAEAVVVDVVDLNSNEDNNNDTNSNSMSVEGYHVTAVSADGIEESTPSPASSLPPRPSSTMVLPIASNPGGGDGSRDDIERQQQDQHQRRDDGNGNAMFNNMIVKPLSVLMQIFIASFGCVCIQHGTRSSIISSAAAADTILPNFDKCIASWSIVHLALGILCAGIRVVVVTHKNSSYYLLEGISAFYLLASGFATTCVVYMACRSWARLSISLKRISYANILGTILASILFIIGYV